jgi:hypothetical protein
MDAMGIDMQLVLPSPNKCYYTVPSEIAVKAARNGEYFLIFGFD